MTSTFDLTAIQDRLDQVSRHYDQYGFTLTFNTNEDHPYLRQAIIRSKTRSRLHTYYVQDVFNLESHSLYQELAFLEWFASTLQTIDTNLQYFEQVTAYVKLSYRGETGIVTVNRTTWYASDELYQTRRHLTYELMYVVHEGMIQKLETTITLPLLADEYDMSFNLPKVSDDYKFQLETTVDIITDEEYDLLMKLAVTRDVTPIHSISQLDTIIEDISKVGETIMNTKSPEYRLA